MEKRSLKKSADLPDQQLDDFDDFLGEIEAVLDDEYATNGTTTETSASSGESISAGEYVERGGQKISFLYPPADFLFLPSLNLSMLSSDGDVFFLTGQETPGSLTTLRSILVSPGQAIASIDQNAPLHLPQNISANVTILTPGSNIKLLSTGDYIAEQFGYICIVKNTLSIVAPLLVDKEKLSVSIMLLSGEQPKRITPDMLRFWLNKSGILTELNQNLIVKLTNDINNNTAQPGVYRIGSGVPPVHGIDGKIDILVDITSTVGTTGEDGSINFKNINFVSNIEEGQLIARKTPATPGTAGIDIYGQNIPAVSDSDPPLHCGQNVTMKNEGLVELYYATSKGAVNYSKNKISVAKRLVLEDGVNFKTGNIDFVGDVFIQGQILPGFSVRALGNVIISGTVENQTTICAGGNVNVGRGVVGHKTLIEAGGNLRVQFIHEATVVAKGDIEIGSYCYHGKIRSNKSISVQCGVGQNAGSIMGGTTWAFSSIETFNAGAPSWIETELFAGLPPEQFILLDSLQENIESHIARINQVLILFGLTRIDLEKIKSIILSAEGAKRKGLAYRAKHLAKTSQTYKLLIAERKKVLDEIQNCPKGANIRIKDTVFPGTVIRIGSQKKIIEDEQRGKTYQLQNGVFK